MARMTANFCSRPSGRWKEGVGGGGDDGGPQDIHPEAEEEGWGGGDGGGGQGQAREGEEEGGDCDGWSTKY